MSAKKSGTIEIMKQQSNTSDLKARASKQLREKNIWNQYITPNYGKR
jgi:hypothetical protein